MTSEAATHAERDWFAAEGETWIKRLQAAGPVPDVRGGDLAGGAMPHDTVPGYVLLREIGRGGQGVVYAALQVATRREVAIKLLREGPLATDSMRRRFAREIELAAGLDHPGIVRIFEAGETADGRPFVVMEFITGDSLLQWAESTSASVRERLHRLADLCDAVEHAHRRGVIHLDIKPSNTLVTADGSVKVVDFGLARCPDEQDATVTMTEAAAAGTPAYMAPEQVALPRAQWDRRTDIHAIGLLLFELVSGGLPYDLTGGALQMMETIARGRPRRLSAAVTGASPELTTRLARDLDAVAEKALAKDPDARYDTAEALGVDLRAAAAGQPVAARHRERGYRWRRVLIDHAPLVAGVTIVFIAIVAVAVFFFDLSRTEAAQRALAERRLADVRTLANTFIHELDPMIRFLPGAAPARERIVSEGLLYLAAMNDAATTDPALAVEVASAYVAIGDVLYETNASHLGEPERAIESHTAACAVLEHVPETSDVLAVRAKAWLRRGAAEQDIGRVDASLQSLRTAESFALKRSDESPTGLDLARIRGRLAKWEMEYGDPGRGEALEREVHAVYARRVAERPDDLLVRRDYAVGFARLARIHADRGERAKALELYERFRDEANTLLRLDPDAVYLQTDLAAAHEWIGRTRADLGDPHGALKPLARAAQLLEEILRRDGTATTHRFALASVVNRRGEAQLAIGDLDGAAETFARFETIAGELRAEYPRRSRGHRLFAVARYKAHELSLARAEATPATSTAAATADATADARLSHLRAARTALESSRACFEGMEQRGLLDEGDRAVPAALADELAALDRRIREVAGSG